MSADGVDGVDGAGAALELDDELPLDGDVLGAVEDDEGALVAGGLSRPQAASANAAATATSNSLLIQVVPLEWLGDPGYRAAPIVEGPARHFCHATACFESVTIQP